MSFTACADIMVKNTFAKCTQPSDIQSKYSKVGRKETACKAILKCRFKSGVGPKTLINFWWCLDKIRGIILLCHIFHNRQILNRSIKWLTVAWRLKKDNQILHLLRGRSYKIMYTNIFVKLNYSYKIVNV